MFRTYAEQVLGCYFWESGEDCRDYFPAKRDGNDNWQTDVSRFPHPEHPSDEVVPALFDAQCSMCNRRFNVTTKAAMHAARQHYGDHGQLCLHCYDPSFQYYGRKPGADR